MRLGAIILLVAAVAVTVVQFRRAQTVARHRILQLQHDRVRLRRELQDQQVVLARKTTPAQVRRRAEQMGIPLVSRGEAGGRGDLAVGDAGPRRGPRP